MASNFPYDPFDDGCTPGERAYLQHLDRLPYSPSDRDWDELPNTAKEHWDMIGGAIQRAAKDASIFDLAERGTRDDENMGGREETENSRRRQSKTTGRRGGGKDDSGGRTRDLVDRRRKDKKKKLVKGRMEGLSAIAQRVRTFLDEQKRVTGYPVHQQKAHFSLPLQPRREQQIQPVPQFSQAFEPRVISRPIPEPISPIPVRGSGKSLFILPPAPRLLTPKPALPIPSIRKVLGARIEHIDSARSFTNQIIPRVTEPVPVIFTYIPFNPQPLKRILYVPAVIIGSYVSPYPALHTTATQSQSASTSSLASVAPFNSSISNAQQLPPQLPPTTTVVSSDFVVLPRSGTVAFKSTSALPSSDQYRSSSGSISSHHGKYLSPYSFLPPSQNETSSTGLVNTMYQTPVGISYRLDSTPAKTKKLPPLFLFPLGSSRRLLDPHAANKPQMARGDSRNAVSSPRPDPTHQEADSSHASSFSPADFPSRPLPQSPLTAHGESFLSRYELEKDGSLAVGLGRGVALDSASSIPTTLEPLAAFASDLERSSSPEGVATAYTTVQLGVEDFAPRQKQIVQVNIANEGDLLCDDPNSISKARKRAVESAKQMMQGFEDEDVGYLARSIGELFPQ